jgi:hypothetical protein
MHANLKNRRVGMKKAFHPGELIPDPAQLGPAGGMRT